jgi:NADH-quinone oxidoreductase subunit L
MYRLLWLVPVVPLLGFLTLIMGGGRLPRRNVAILGVGSVGLAALITLLVTLGFLVSPPPGQTYVHTLWVWFAVADVTPTIAFHLDALSLVMTLVVTGVGFCIHLYAAAFMWDEEGYSRFFAYLNLFVAAMLILVLADNLLLLYLGWEGVGLCSYLLIGFWYRDPANGGAARKAFLVTRIGDTAMAIGLFVLLTHLGTLDIQTILQRAAQTWPVGAGLATATALLLLGGALGKSAQLPLHVWLPDAMAGPTPVSALIHAATMVTAGVYLIARLHGLFTLAPGVQTAVAVIGALTLLIAGCSALTQRDIKRVLAYSTISQIGYMFVALGVGAWSAAVFHLMTHAFFKALLFLAAGAVILSLHHEHDIFRMGGLRRDLPVTFWTFLIGSASLAGVPLVTAGFYSKDLILWQAWAGPRGSELLWVAGLVGAFLTALYIFRVVFRVFYGPIITPVDRRPSTSMRVALLTLAVLSIVGGWLELPGTLGHLTLFSDFLHSALPALPSVDAGIDKEFLSQLLAAAVALLGIALAYLVFGWRPRIAEALARAPVTSAVYRWWLAGWGIDWLYNLLVVRPFVALAQLNRDDLIDALYQGVVVVFRLLHDGVALLQTGKVRWYAASMTAGAVIVIALVVFS